MFEPWPIEPLGNHCSVRARIGWRGLASSEYTTDGPFLIAGKHVRNGQIDWATCDHITDYRYNESPEIALESGDVVLTKDGTIGRVARIDHLPGRATLNGTMMLLRSGNRLDYRFLFHLLNGTQFKKLIADKVSGSSIPHIFQRDMVSLPIPIPPKKQQRDIAVVLDTIDTTIRQTEVIIEKLKQVKQGLLHDLLTRGINANGELRPLPSQAPHLYKDSPLGWIPKEWQCEIVGNVIDSSPKNGIYKPPQDIGFGALLVGQTAFTREGSVDFSQARRAYISSAELAAFGLCENDLLVSRVFATREGVGQPVIVPALTEAAVYESNMMRLRSRQETLEPHLLFHWLKGQIARSWIMARAFASNQASINRETLCSVPLPLPPKKEQLGMHRLIGAHDDRAKKETHALEKMRELKFGIMDDLLTGRIRVAPLLEPQGA